MRFILHILLTTIVYCDRPIYDCKSPCIGKTSSMKKQYIFQTDAQETDTFVVPNKTKYTVYFAKKYNHINLTITNTTSLTNFSYSETELSPMYQILKYTVSTGESIQHTLISLSSNESISWQVEIGEQNQFTVYQLLAIPLDMIFLHGHYWSKLFYEWIFFLVTFIMAILINSLETKKNTSFLNSLLLYSSAGFLASAGSKLYHTIVAALNAKTFDKDFVFTIIVVCILIEIAPIFIALLTSYYINKYTLITIVLTSIISIGLLFLGSGYFVGPCFLFLSCIFKFIHISIQTT